MDRMVWVVRITQVISSNKHELDPKVPRMSRRSKEDPHITSNYRRRRRAQSRKNPQ